jgi:hypothetical protein
MGLVEIQRAFRVAKKIWISLSVGFTGCLQRPSLTDGLDQCCGVQLDSQVFVLVCVSCVQEFGVLGSLGTKSSDSMDANSVAGSTCCSFSVARPS